MKLSEKFRRWRASKGYGVHSPLAFRLVKNVVKPQRGYTFYGEEQLEALSAARRDYDSTLLKRAKLLLRLVAELRPSFVWTAPGLPEIMLEAVRLAGAAIRLYDGKIFPNEHYDADLIVIQGKKHGSLLNSSFFKPGKSLLAFDVPEGVSESVGAMLPGGVVLQGGDSLIVVATADADVHSYQLSKF